MPKWLFWLALFFVLFLIYNQPDNAGNVAGGFAEFAVDLLDALVEFVSGLFEGASNSDGSSGLDNSGLTNDTGPTTDPAFTHTHDGSTHTHGG